MGRVYATHSDLVSYAPADVTVPEQGEADRMLARASEAVEDLTAAAVYPTDSGGLPTDDTHVTAMRDATCAQVVWWLDTGDELGTAGQWGNVAAGSISLSRGSTGYGTTPGHTPDTVARPLRLAGLLPGAPLHP